MVVNESFSWLIDYCRSHLKVHKLIILYIAYHSAKWDIIIDFEI
jgi:hypothetical protein